MIHDINKSAVLISTVIKGLLCFETVVLGWWASERPKFGIIKTFAICQKKDNDGSTFESVLVVMNKF